MILYLLAIFRGHRRAGRDDVLAVFFAPLRVVGRVWEYRYWTSGEMRPLMIMSGSEMLAHELDMWVK